MHTVLLQPDVQKHSVPMSLKETVRKRKKMEGEGRGEFYYIKSWFVL